eukprot:8459164-Pyramimonas_sp.AAC.1
MGLDVSARRPGSAAAEGGPGATQQRPTALCRGDMGCSTEHDTHSNIVIQNCKTLGLFSRG